METISQLGSVIKLTVFFNLMPAITGVCFSFPPINSLPVTILMGGGSEQPFVFTVCTCWFSLL